MQEHNFSQHFEKQTRQNLWFSKFIRIWYSARKVTYATLDSYIIYSFEDIAESGLLTLAKESPAGRFVSVANEWLLFLMHRLSVSMTSDNRSLQEPNRRIRTLILFQSIFSSFRRSFEGGKYFAKLKRPLCEDRLKKGANIKDIEKIPSEKYEADEGWKFERVMLKPKSRG